MTIRRRAQDGLTLIELLLAAAIATVLVLAIGNMDVTRILIAKDVVATTNFQAEAERLAAGHLPKRLEQADRINLICDGTVGCATPFETNIQIRFPEPDTDGAGCTCATGVPEPCCFDIAANYRWVQYRFTDTPVDADANPDTVFFYDDTGPGPGAGNCSNVRTLARQITALRLTYTDEALLPPPGGEPFAGVDNNVMQIQVDAPDPSAPGGVRMIETHVTIRAAAYTNVGAGFGGVGDSGTGLEAPGTNVNPPPVPCS